jgi:two-component system chemotaxis response regulator CheB
MTGTRDDGSAGLITVRRAGGVAVVQDPMGAAYGEMPWSALDAAGADYIVPLEDIPSLLDRLVRQTNPPGTERPDAAVDPSLAGR